MLMYKLAGTAFLLITSSFLFCKFSFHIALCQSDFLNIEFCVHLNDLLYIENFHLGLQQTCSQDLMLFPECQLGQFMINVIEKGKSGVCSFILCHRF